MTNGWVDIKNTDMMLVMGGNPAENHPCGFKWAIEAKRTRNAPLIVVDPRYTRTAAVSDLFAQIRAGSDIALLGAIINYALQNNRVNHEYLVNYTNAAFIIKEGFQLPEEGLFSGYNADTHSYDKSTWNYEEGGNLVPKIAGVASTAPHSAAPATYDKSTSNYEQGGNLVPRIAGAPLTAEHGAAPTAAAGHAGQTTPALSGLAAASGSPPAMPENIAYDTSLQHPRCVYQLMKRQYSRYTPELVERITGIPKEQILKVADLFTSIRKDGDVKKVGTIIYAVGWTQHSSGTQTIRAAALLQLLLGNIGRAGGGVNALRGHSNIQGATDMAGIFDLLPGYLKVPIPADTDLNAYLKRTTTTPAKPAEWASFNYFSNTSKFAVSLLKSLYGDAATKENGFAFDYLPKVDRNYSWTELWDGMYRGEVKGLFAFGMNGVMIGPNSSKNINALKKADWLVVCELYPDETSDFWRSPGITPEEMKTINTTVYRLPGAGFAEKDGTMVNSARWLQWKWIAVPPPGDAMLDQAILARIFLKVRELYKTQGGKFPDPILNVTWNYTDKRNPSLSEIAKELNGKALADVTDAPTNTTIKAGQQLPGFGLLRDDGSTACGNWIYCGSWTEAGPMMQRRATDDPSGLGAYPNWAWSWPANRRVLYNRASCDSSGKPWDATRAQVWWNEAAKKWVGNDVPDFKADSAPQEHMGPFIMNAEGVGRLFVPLGMVSDGPFPEHYETFESPVQNLLHPQQNTNPVAKKFKSAADKYGTPAEGFNIVCTTYRLTEHYHYWTKNNPVNVQLVPEPFVEIPAELADEMGIHGGEKVRVSSARGHYIAKAMVTRRIHSMLIDGKKTYQIGIPIHWGYRGIQEDLGRTALTIVNSLTLAAIDPNAFTPEFKGFLVKLEKV